MDICVSFRRYLQRICSQTTHKWTALTNISSFDWLKVSAKSGITPKKTQETMCRKYVINFQVETIDISIIIYHTIDFQSNKNYNTMYALACFHSRTSGVAAHGTCLISCNQIVLFLANMMSTKTAIGIAASAGIAFIGYCIYFDHKRRSDPDFKKKLRERKYLSIHHY